MDSDLNSPVDDIFWIKKVIFQKPKNGNTCDKTVVSGNNKRYTADRFSTTEEDTKKIDNPKLSKGIKKLRFKNKNISAKFLNRTTSQVPRTGDKDSDELPKVSGQRPVNIIEYQTNNSKYTMLAFDESEIPVKKEILLDLSDTSDEESASVDSDNSVSDIEEELDSYKQYLKKWERLESGIEWHTLPLPIDENDTLNPINVKKFVGSKSNLKRERIRWHPDKMKNNLITNNVWNAEYEGKITLVFQVVNEAFELELNKGTF